MNGDVHIPNAVEWVKDYLRPQPGQRTPRVHQFTINGLTYPFVRDFHFGALPDPPGPRRYSLLAGLYLIRQGDLVFFFQADPQFDPMDVKSRRGFRGIWRVASDPFTDPVPVADPITNYVIHGVCLNCGTFHSTMAEYCDNCGQAYPTSQFPTRPSYRQLVLGLRIALDPVIVFERTVSDERAYADMRSDRVLLWVGRHDNAMGPGKGSSIRQLLPHEAVKLAGLFATEPGQSQLAAGAVPYPNPRLQVVNDDNTPVEHLEIERRPQAGDIVKLELMLNFHLAQVMDRVGGSFAAAIGLNPDRVIYASSEFPWGYTACNADFVLVERLTDQEWRIAVVEFKRDAIDDMAVIQASLYVPWVVQTIVQFANPPPTDIRVIPVVVGQRVHANVCSPDSYGYHDQFLSGVGVDVVVERPTLVTYAPVAYQAGPLWRAADLQYHKLAGAIPAINWKPDTGAVTTRVEMSWVRAGSWHQARLNAGLPG